MVMKTVSFRLSSHQTIVLNLALAFLNHQCSNCWTVLRFYLMGKKCHICKTLLNNEELLVCYKNTACLFNEQWLNSWTNKPFYLSLNCLMLSTRFYNYVYLFLIIFNNYALNINKIVSTYCTWFLRCSHCLARLVSTV